MFSNAKNRLASLAKMEKVERPKEIWRQALDPINTAPPKKVIVTTNNVDKVVNNLNELIPLALDAHYQILKNTPLNPNSEEYIPNARLVLATAQSIMSAQIKVDENQLRGKKQEDILTILQELRDEEKKQALIELSLKDQ